MNPPAPNAQPSTGRVNYTLAEAMAKTGTTTPKAALAKMNEGRHGRKRLALSPLDPKSPWRGKERARRLRQEAKAAAKAEARAQVAAG